MNADTQRNVVGRLHFALGIHGTLFLGHAEMLLSHGEQFTPLSLKHRIFRKAPGSHGGLERYDPAATMYERHGDDSIAYPFESDTKYPYTLDGTREFLDGKAFIETFVLTAALGAVTTTLRFNFFVLKLPVRPPALVAKQAGSLAALIGNRVGLGWASARGQKTTS